MRILIAGSSGLIGSALIETLRERGDHVTRLVRSQPEADDLVWNPDAGTVDVLALDGFDAVIHLGGVSIGERRWSEAERGRIWDSRVNSTELISRALSETINRPRTLLVASAIGYYGNAGETVVDEQSPNGDDFLSQVTKHWEEAAEPARAAGIRTVHLRTGIVLSEAGGIVKRLLPVFKTAMGGRLGTGDQYMSWISLRDEVNAIVFALDHDQLSGPLVLCAPKPATNQEFTRAFAHAVRRPAPIPVWPWLLHLAFGRQLTDEVLLTSQRGHPSGLLRAGFRFQDTGLQATFDQIAGRVHTETPNTATDRLFPSRSRKKKNRD